MDKIKTAEQLALLLYIEYCEHVTVDDKTRWCYECLLKFILELEAKEIDLVSVAIAWSAMRARDFEREFWTLKKKSLTNKNHDL